jgi:catechol 2,3-dioxygenase-like lactoylglutathione lyase family enzyme/GNAT superfamily N-acetyltransferase
MLAGDIEIIPFEEAHRTWAECLLVGTWGGSRVVSRGQVHDALHLSGFVALAAGEPAGLATYHLSMEACELVTINSLQSGLGIGSALIGAVKETAAGAGCRRLWLITTNDNLAALRFYQKQGFALAALHRDAIRLSRRLKPHIPLLGKDGIPIRDELELELLLTAPQEAASLALNHALVTIPVGAEEEARDFYCRLLGLVEIRKPDALQGRGGLWLQVGDHQVHLGVQDVIDRQASRSHLAYEVNDLAAWRSRLAARGLETAGNAPIPGYDRLEFRDPFGNRIELIQRL